MRFICGSGECYSFLCFRDSASLIPYIFRFLVLLSYERSQSSAMNVPRLIQLCDGVMAGGLAAEDYSTDILYFINGTLSYMFLVSSNPIAKTCCI